MKLKRTKIFRNVVIVAVSLSMLLLMILPLYAFYSVPEEISDGIWETVYLFQAPELLLIVLSFCTAYLFSTIVKKTLFRRISKIITLLIAGILLLFGLATGLLAQDFSPMQGSLIFLPLLPLVMLQYYLDWEVRELQK